MPALAGVADGSCQPEKPAGKTQQLVYRCPLGITLQVGANLSPGDEPKDNIGEITDLDQQVEAGHEQQEDPGEQCSGNDEEPSDRPALPPAIPAPPTQHRSSHDYCRDACHNHDDPGHARSEPSKQRPQTVGHGFGGVRESVTAHRPVDPQRGVDERPCHSRVGRPALPVANPSNTSGHDTGHPT